MEGADVVYHLAANPDIARAAREPDIDFHAGTALTQIVLEAMRLNRVLKIFFTSGSRRLREGCEHGVPGGPRAASTHLTLRGQ